MTEPLLGGSGLVSFGMRVNLSPGLQNRFCRYPLWYPTGVPLRGFWDAVVAFIAIRKEMLNTQTGELSELLAKEPFMRAGYWIYAKSGPGTIDFIALHPKTGEICRVEVKTCRTKSFRPILQCAQSHVADLVAAVDPDSGKVKLMLPSACGIEAKRTKYRYGSFVSDKE